MIGRRRPIDDSPSCTSAPTAATPARCTCGCRRTTCPTLHPPREQPSASSPTAAHATAGGDSWAVGGRVRRARANGAPTPPPRAPRRYDACEPPLDLPASSPPRPSEPHHITRLGLTCSLWRGRVRQRALWWLGGAGRAVCASAPRASHASCITAALNSGHGSKQQGRRGRHHRRRGRVRLRRVSAARPAFRCSRTRPTTHGRPQHA